jgi:hypothetical protein
MEAVVFDYDSTDNTRAIFESEAPTGWKIQTSHNREFDAILVDREIMAHESQCPPSTWKLCLTVTEFLVHATFLASLATAPVGDNARQYRAFYMAGDNTKRFDLDQPLVNQRHFYTLHPRLAEYCRVIYSRFIHRHAPAHGYYMIGRHELAMPYRIDDDGYILKFVFAPWPQLRARKIQVQPRIPAVRRANGDWFWPDSRYDEEAAILMAHPLVDIFDATANSKLAAACYWHYPEHMSCAQHTPSLSLS